MIARSSRMSLLGFIIPVVSNERKSCRGGGAVHMAEVAARVDPVAHAPLQLLHVREAAVALSFPDDFAVHFDPEGAAGGGDQCDLAKILGKSREELLRHPGRTKQPVALTAIGDRDPRHLPPRLLTSGFGRFIPAMRSQSLRIQMAEIGELRGDRQASATFRHALAARPPTLGS